MHALDAIFERRSSGRLCHPGPEGDDLRRILEAAVAAPDHGRLRPWKLVVLSGETKDAFGHVLADALVVRRLAEGTPPRPEEVARERTKLSRAPVVVVAAALRRESRCVPWEEQLASAAAAAQNILLAATALGYGSMWRTGDAAYDRLVKSALGLTHDDAIVGFLYLGSVPDGAAAVTRDRTVSGVVLPWERSPAP